MSPRKPRCPLGVWAPPLIQQQLVWVPLMLCDIWDCGNLLSKIYSKPLVLQSHQVLQEQVWAHRRLQGTPLGAISFSL